MQSHFENAYFWSCGESTNFAVSLLKYTIEVNKILSIVKKNSNLFLRYNLSVSSYLSEIVYDTLVGIQSQLWLNTFFVERFKIRLPRGGLMKMVICLLNSYSDDTSENSSKQYNKYNSYLTHFAVMPLEVRNNQENAMFISTSNHMLNAVEMLPPIVNDFVKLEKGIVIYSNDYDEDFLIVASLLLFMGDNPWQLQLAMHSGTLGKHFCRKYSELYKHGCDLNYSKNSSNEFLRLEAFDATKYMPIEILHIIPLGLSQYLVTCLLKFSRMSTAEMARLESAMSSYRVCKSYSRRFRNQLCHNDDASSLKCYDRAFSGNSKFELLTKTLHVVAKLSSLLYMRGISKDFDYYIVLIKHTVNEVTNPLLALDIHIEKSNYTKQDLIFKPKVYLLYHIAKDIVCFGSVLQYKTENGKQFNKFICEHLFQTNIQSTSRDVALRFGKQFICCYLCNNGYYNAMMNMNGTSQQVRCTAGKYVQELYASSEFRRHFFRSQPNTDNFSLLTPTLCNTLLGVFQANGQIFFGQVKTISMQDIINNFVKKQYMQKYQMISSNSIECIYIPPVITANMHNIVVVPFGYLLEIRKE
ncbi:hypothetical protein F4703DRAFT_1958173 [Phycomyces blakesleeanus]